MWGFNPLLVPQYVECCKRAHSFVQTAKADVGG